MQPDPTTPTGTPLELLNLTAEELELYRRLSRRAENRLPTSTRMAFERIAGKIAWAGERRRQMDLHIAQALGGTIDSALLSFDELRELSNIITAGTFRSSGFVAASLAGPLRHRYHHLRGQLRFRHGTS